MPEIKPPIIVEEMLDIQLFARAYFNLELTTWQLKFIEAMAKGQGFHYGGKQAGKTTAVKVMGAYIQAGLKPYGRARIPTRAIPQIDKSKFKTLTQEGKILALIERPGGAFNFELSRYALKYTSVISELRKDGHIIIAERQILKNGKKSNTFLYRMGGQ